MESILNGFNFVKGFSEISSHSAAFASADLKITISLFTVATLIPALILFVRHLSITIDVISASE